MSIKVSLIVPIFNSAQYLRKCLDSLVSQTLGELEIICINDCSPSAEDGEIVREYMRKDDRIISLEHQVNKKQGGARNTGLGVARGDYVWFIDSDDFIDANAVEFLYRTAVGGDFEAIGISATSHVDGNLYTSEKINSYSRDDAIVDRPMSGKEFLHEAVRTGSMYVPPWAYFFSRELLGEWRFREHVFYEDNDYVPIALRRAKRILCTHYAPYYRLVHAGSVTQQGLSEEELSYKCLYVDAMLDYLEKENSDRSDPLVDYTALQYRYVVWQYGQWGLGSDDLERCFQMLEQRYLDVIGKDHEVPQVLDCKELRQQYRKQQRQLEALRNSLGGRMMHGIWKMSGLVRRWRSQ